MLFQLTKMIIKPIIIIIICFSIAIPKTVLASTTPYFTDTDSTRLTTLTIDNRTDDTVSITLTGPENYVVNSKPGKTKLKVIPGIYRYSYFTCGRYDSDQIDLSKKKNTLSTFVCHYTKIVIENLTGDLLHLTIKNSSTKYTYALIPGKTNILISGSVIDYSAKAICGTKSGAIRLTRRNISWIWYCVKEKIKEKK
jgi:hypothetical protein